MAAKQEQEEKTLTSEEIQDRLAKAYQDYVRALNNAWIPDETRTRLEESHREFVRTVQETWAGMDVSALDSNTLRAISQSLMTAAWMAESTGIG